MNDERSVWIVEVGDCSLSFIQSVFATKELADDYCARFQKDSAPVEFVVIETAPYAVTHYEIDGVFGDDSRMASAGSGWVQRGGGYQNRKSWASDTAYCPKAVDGRISWRHRDDDISGPVRVEVSGYDGAAVEARFAELWDAVLRGERPPLRSQKTEQGE